MPNETGSPGQTGSSAAGASNNNGTQATTAITPELVKKVADKVYAMLSKELQIERERGGAHRHTSTHWRGGR